MSAFATIKQKTSGLEEAPTEEQLELGKSLRRAMTATKTEDPIFTYRLLSQAVMTHPGYKEDGSRALSECVSFVESIAPRDRLEGILATQMLALHNLAMKVIERASLTNERDAFNSDTDRAVKLMRTFAIQLSALTGYRGRGTQKITVEHVNVNAGGQAIVGTVN